MLIPSAPEDKELCDSAGAMSSITSMRIIQKDPKIKVIDSVKFFRARSRTANEVDAVP
jgi:hypothetical protein